MGTPLDFGRRELTQVAGVRAQDIDIQIKPSSAHESYTISSSGGKVRIVGSDPTGAMYGAFEFAERLKNLGDKAWSTQASGKPFMADRGLNLFLTLPWNYGKNNTDYDVAALTDPNRWWFDNDDYWTTLLDTMARSRFNLLDIHGMWDISITNAPNLYAYFVKSPSFEKVGVPDDVKAKLLGRLNWVVSMAHARGIRVSLMAYEANLKVPQNPNPPYSGNESNVYKYTRESVEGMIRGVPGLDAIGFRIGESGRGESFFKCYGDAVKASGRNIPLITRSWITTKQRVLPLARASKDFTVEIKYNGEQWGAPYPVVGGRFANWHSYSYEDYLSDSGLRGSNAKNWPGRVAEGGGRWPSEPYKIVWQVRASGTHRIFPFYNPEWVRRSIKAMDMGTASGYTIEGEDAYYPKSPDYYLANPKDKAYDWIHQRDEMYWMTWGRLGYDPTTPDATFDHHAVELLGPGSEGLVSAWKDSSVLLPFDFMAYALGPDHRDHAPELEWGGDTNAFMEGAGLDEHSFIPINEQLANEFTGGLDGRRDSTNLPMRRMFGQMASTTLRGKEIADSVGLLDDLDLYYRERFAVASSLASILKPGSRPGQEAMPTAAVAYGLLAKNPYYKPFTERLRMGTNTFSWDNELKKVTTEAARIHALPVSDAPSRSTDFPRGDCKLTWKDDHGDIVCAINNSEVTRAWLLVKPLPSSTYFHKIPMDSVGNQFTTKFKRERWGYDVAAEVEISHRVIRIPNLVTQTPYEVIPALAGPTPQIYNSSEAMTYLDPQKIDPVKYSGMLLGTRAWHFFGGYDKSIKRKLLDPVTRGMRLVILQQDFGRYKLDFLPKPLRLQGGNVSVFDPAGAYGLPKVACSDIMYQRFLPSDGWEILGNGGLARLKIGKGEVLVCSARLEQRMNQPVAAQAFVKLLSLGGTEKPTILIDSSSESAVYTNSTHPDLMNSHGIPFVTLGEMIAQEQKMASFKPIPGPIMTDDILQGKGAQMANAFLRKQVTSLAARPTPSNLDEFEKERHRRKKEILKSLGLDPMPVKTPLNERITGVIQRPGYKIQKLVFESRPKFYVTAYIYKSDTAPTGKLPVIVNVNGHWAHKKAEDRLQLRCAFEALKGYLVICVDSPGHSFEGNSLIERRPEGDHNDFALVEGGSNATGYYVWDAIRALDYINTRPDADMDHVGLTGASGGGLATLYTFAADDRYKAAVPVVYMASLELAPDNGCLCNHVPGTIQAGDRSDVIAIQAPKPVYIMGARDDGEFPAEATLHTHDKMEQTWSLFGKGTDVYAQIFAGPHDYNQPMREAMIGFFDKYLKGVGDASPVPEPKIDVFDPEDRQYLVLDTPIAGERTMRDLSQEYLDASPKSVPLSQVFAVNGGLPKESELHYKEIGTGSQRAVTFESEPGLVTPGILYLPKGQVKGVRIIASDASKQAEILANPPSDGYACLYLDILGTGELAGIEERYPVYLGTSVPFTGGWQLVRAAEAMKKYSGHVELVGRGPISSLAATYAGVMDSLWSKVTGIDGLKDWSDVFRDGVNSLAVQPRAHLCGSLENLRAKVKNGEWGFSHG